MSALASLQRDDGMFHTLLNDSTSPVESSGMAGIAYGVLAGIRLQMIGDGYETLVHKALTGVLQRIDEEGLHYCRMCLLEIRWVTIWTSTAAFPSFPHLMGKPWPPCF